MTVAWKIKCVQSTGDTQKAKCQTIIFDSYNCRGTKHDSLHV